MSWTEERVEQLIQCWNKGMSAGQIAKELGDVTRNAVIGKAHRLGLPPRPSPIKKSATPAAAKKTKTKADSNANNTANDADTSMPAVLKNLQPLKPLTKNITELQSVSRHGCQWPIGDPRDPEFKLCGEQALPSKPYCKHHAQMAYQNYGGKSTSNKLAKRKAANKFKLSEAAASAASSGAGESAV